MANIKLKPIMWDEDLSAFDLDSVAEGCITTYLELSDYDWMNYVFKSTLPTKDQGKINFRAEFYGSDKTMVKIHQSLNNLDVEYDLDVPTVVFSDFLVDYLSKHIAQWESTNSRAFCGEKEAIELFNRSITEATRCEISVKTHSCPIPI